MARNINWSEPLSDEDRVWAEQRLDTQSGQDGLTIGEQIQKNDEVHGKQAKDARKSRAERLEDLRTTIADSENEISRLQQEEADEANANRALAGSVGDRAAGLIVKDNTPVNGETPEGAPTGTEDYSDERYWTKAKLSETIDNRNTDRQADGLEPLSKSGTRAELVERLRKDDEELAQAGE